jgi:hypothetical protein
MRHKDNKLMMSPLIQKLLNEALARSKQQYEAAGRLLPAVQTYSSGRTYWREDYKDCRIEFWKMDSIENIDHVEDPRNDVGTSNLLGELLLWGESHFRPTIGTAEDVRSKFIGSEGPWNSSCQYGDVLPDWHYAEHRIALARHYFPEECTRANQHAGNPGLFRYINWLYKSYQLISIPVRVVDDGSRCKVEFETKTSSKFRHNCSPGSKITNVGFYFAPLSRSVGFLSPVISPQLTLPYPEAVVDTVALTKPEQIQRTIEELVREIDLYNSWLQADCYRLQVWKSGRAAAVHNESGIIGRSEWPYYIAKAKKIADTHTYNSNGVNYIHKKARFQHKKYSAV